MSIDSSKREARPEDVRRRIGVLPKSRARYILMANYLLGCRISELISVKSPGDTTTARGGVGSDVSIVDYEQEGVSAQAVLFRLKTAKREGEPRIVALPMDPKFEPWAKELADYSISMGSEPVFPFTRQLAFKYAQKTFKGLWYKIEKYYSITDEQKEQILKDGEKRERTLETQHLKRFGLHALRHVRSSELVEYYGFDAFDLALFGGWSMNSATSRAGVSSAMARYLSLRWQGYFGKLLKRRY